MTPGELVRRQIRHEETAPVPYTLAFEGDVPERLDEYYGSREWRDAIVPYVGMCTAVGTMKKRETDRPGYQIDPYGSVWRVDRRPFHLERPGLEKPSFAGYRWPSPEEFFLDRPDLETARRFVDEHREQRYILANLGWGLFETSWGIRGFEGALADSVSEEEFYDELIERATAQFLSYINFTLDELPGIDGIMFGDDWGYQQGVLVGPERWRRFFKERYRRIYAAVHARGKTVVSHCCGSIVDILDDVVEIGLDVLESVQPEARGMNPYELKERWGSELCFWGALGSQSTIQFGPPEAIRSEVARLYRDMGVGGGYILAPAKGLQPGTPIEHAAAVVEAVTGYQA